MAIVYDNIVEITNEVLKRYIIMSTYIYNEDSLSIRGYVVKGGEIVISYSEKREYLGTTESYYKEDTYNMSIIEYISLSNLIVMEKMEERISQIGNGYLI